MPSASWARRPSCEPGLEGRPKSMPRCPDAARSMRWPTWRRGAGLARPIARAEPVDRSGRRRPWSPSTRRAPRPSRVPPTRRRRPRVQFGDDRPAQGGPPHPRVRWGWPRRTGCGALGLGPTTASRSATPPSHILGLLNLLAAVSAGATVRLHRRFDLDEVLRRIATEQMTLEMAVAPIALALANHPHLEDYDLSSLRYIMWGATPVTAERGRSSSRPGPGCAGCRPTAPARCR